MRLTILASILACATLAGCASGNLKTAADYHAPPARPVADPSFNPYAPYGSTHATWEPPVLDRWQTIVKPNDPSVTLTRPDYEAAPWATGAKGSGYNSMFE